MMIRYAILSLILSIGSFHIPVQSACASEGDALAQKFFAHLKANAPISGVFEIRTEKDREGLEKQKQSAQGQSGKRTKMTFGESNQLLECRWAWDGRRELCESLAGSRNVFEHGTFFQNQEALLLGHSKNSFSLRANSSPAVWRPASFYYLSSTSPWSHVLEDCIFDYDKNAKSTEDGHVTLIARGKDGHREHRLTMHKETGVLKKAQTLFDAQLVFDLQITSYVNGPNQRCFPDKAVLDIYVPQLVVGRPMTRHALTAKKVEFPEAHDSNSYFRLELPKGARVGDQILDRVIDLETSTQAIDIIEGKVKSRPASQFNVVDNLAPHSAVGNGQNWKWVLPSALCAIVAGLIVIRLTKKGVSLNDG